MARGTEVLVQATLFDGTWLGRADVLMRVPTPSERWAWSYEVVDTKLALTTRPSAIVQLCGYSGHVARVQGRQPQHMHVVLGDDTLRRYALNSHGAFYRVLVQTFHEHLASAGDTYPLPVSHCKRCVWNEPCAQRREDDDHLSIVARIRTNQIARLEARGITTVAALGRADDGQRPPRLSETTFATLRRQAALQSAQRDAERQGRTDDMRYDLLQPRAGEGLALLPPSSPGDVFFDMEGDPLYAFDRGLEYLFGCSLPDDRYIAFWAREVREERSAFERCVDFFVERRAGDPAMHIYHYAPYEKSALRRLAAMYETREREVDDLLRAGAFVDLYAVVRQSVLVSQPSYSIKKLEPFYGFTRSTDVRAGDDSILAFERWRLEPQREELLHDIERYNEDDCRSTAELRRWLDRLRDEAERTFATTIAWRSTAPLDGEGGGENESESKTSGSSSGVDDATGASGAAAVSSASTDASSETPAEGEALVKRLLDGIDAPVSEDELRRLPEPQRARWVLAKLLGYHRREEKPAWWEYFDRCENADALVYGDSRAIGGLVLDTSVEPFKPAPRSRNLVSTYRFPTQPFFLEGESEIHDPHARKRAGDLLEATLDENGGTLRLQDSAKHGDPAAIRALIPGGPLSTAVQQGALRRLATAVLDGSLPERHIARELLASRPPRRRGLPPDALVQPPEPDGAAIADIVTALDASSLFVQGPPGPGKTTRGAAAIVELLARGVRVGVTARSHAAIDNLLDGVDREAERRGVRVRGLRKVSVKSDSRWRFTETSKENADFTSDEVQLAAGTAWLFAREEMRGRFDVLVVDEAGQTALADAVAVCGSARNMLLLGDPLQLQQVSRGIHPLCAGDSVLRYLLGDEATIPPERGIFLDVSYRMHPEICAFISENVYDGRLRASPLTANNALDSPGLSGAGLRYLPIAHEGNGRESAEEAERIIEEITLLLRGRVTIGAAQPRAMSADDVLVVSPYNAQRARIQRCLRDRGLDAVRVGTVDKFQGQQAPVVFYSMATSSDADLPRDLAFLYERNRFNVAISRAQVLCALVASPRLYARAAIRRTRWRWSICSAVTPSAATWSAREHQCRATHMHREENVTEKIVSKFVLGVRS